MTHITTPHEAHIIACAREWIMDRVPQDPSERALMLAVLRACPDSMHCRENCSCEASGDCSECPSAADVWTSLRDLEDQVSRDEANIARRVDAHLRVTTTRTSGEPA